MIPGRVLMILQQKKIPKPEALDQISNSTVPILKCVAASAEVVVATLQTQWKAGGKAGHPAILATEHKKSNLRKKPDQWKASHLLDNSTRGERRGVTPADWPTKLSVCSIWVLLA